MSAEDDPDPAANLVVRVPLHFRRIGGRKVIIAPSGKEPAASPYKPPSALLKAIVQAHKWQRMMSRGDYPTIAEFAAALHLDKSYVSKVLRLTLLAPRLVEAIVWEEEPEGLSISRVLVPFAVPWPEKSAEVTQPATGTKPSKMKTVSSEGTRLPKGARRWRPAQRE